MAVDPLPVSIPRTRRQVVDGPVPGESLELWIAEPVEGFAPLPDRPWRTVWVLDANLFFGTVVETTRLMAQLFAELPPLLVVGVAYPGTDLRSQAALRARDFTPTRDPAFEGSSLPPGGGTGGADAFADVLLGPARDRIRTAYPAHPDGDVVFGSSLGGLFVVHLFLDRPGAFEGHVAVSPALWWDDGLLLRRASEIAAADESAPGADLFLAVGRGEEGDHLPFLAPWRLVSNVEALASTLAAREGVRSRVGHAVIDGETHTSVVQPGLTRGLRWAVGRGAAPALRR